MREAESNMSEDRIVTETPEVPAEENFNTQALQGSMQQILSENLGRYVTVEFLIGTSNVTRRTGFIYSVGISFIVLFDYNNRVYVLCDIFAIKFVTFLPLDLYPAVPEGTVTNMQIAPGHGSPDYPLYTPNLQQDTTDSGTTNSTASAATSAAHTPAGQPRQAGYSVTPRQAAFNYTKRKTR